MNFASVMNALENGSTEETYQNGTVEYRVFISDDSDGLYLGVDNGENTNWYKMDSLSDLSDFDSEICSISAFSE